MYLYFILVLSASAKVFVHQITHTPDWTKINMIVILDVCTLFRFPKRTYVREHAIRNSNKVQKNAFVLGFNYKPHKNLQHRIRKAYLLPIIMSKIS